MIVKEHRKQMKELSLLSLTEKSYKKNEIWLKIAERIQCQAAEESFPRNNINKGRQLKSPNCNIRLEFLNQ